MQTIRVETHVGQDGILKLELPLDITDSDLEVVLVLQRKEKRSWPPGYFERIAGILAEDPLERPPQGTYEERDVLL